MTNLLISIGVPDASRLVDDSCDGARRSRVRRDRKLESSSLCAKSQLFKNYAGIDNFDIEFSSRPSCRARNDLFSDNITINRKLAIKEINNADDSANGSNSSHDFQSMLCSTISSPIVVQHVR